MKNMYCEELKEMIMDTLVEDNPNKRPTATELKAQTVEISNMLRDSAVFNTSYSSSCPWANVNYSFDQYVLFTLISVTN